MIVRFSIIGFISILVLFIPNPAHANMLKEVRKAWKEKVVAPIASPIVQAIKPPMKWTQLSKKEKATKLTKAKEKIGITTNHAFQVLEKFEKRPRFQHTTALIRLDLEDGMDRVKRAETPEEFEDAVIQLQESWNLGKEELRSLL